MRQRKINPARVIENTIVTLEGLSMGLELLGHVDKDFEVDKSKALEWLKALDTGLVDLQDLRDQLARVAS